MGSSTFVRDCKPIEILTMLGNDIARATCDVCATHLDVRVQPRCPPEKIRKGYLNLGWTMGHKLKCPACSQKKSITDRAPIAITVAVDNSPAMDQPAQLPEGALRLMPVKYDEQPQSASGTASSARATDAAKRVKRLVFQALEDGYCDSTKRYRAGWDDARVAKETGAAIEFVRKVREEDFGPLLPPSEIVALKESLEKLATKLEQQQKDAQREMNLLSANIADFYKRNGWA